MRRLLIIALSISLTGCLGGRDFRRTSDSHIYYDAAREERIRELEEKKWMYSRDEQKVMDQEINHLKGNEPEGEEYDLGDLIIDSILGI